MTSNQFTQSIRTSHGIGKGFLVILAMILTSSLLGLQRMSLAEVSPNPTPQNLQASAAQLELSLLSPSPIQDLLELLERLKKLFEEALEKAKEIEEQGGGGTSALFLGLFNDLDMAGTEVSNLFNPLISPRLDPIDAGTADRLLPGLDLLDFANLALLNAEQAIVATNTLSWPLRDEVIGSRIKTIQAILPLYHDAVD